MTRITPIPTASPETSLGFTLAAFVLAAIAITAAAVAVLENLQ